MPADNLISSTTKLNSSMLEMDTSTTDITTSLLGSTLDCPSFTREVKTTTALASLSMNPCELREYLEKELNELKAANAELFKGQMTLL